MRLLNDYKGVLNNNIPFKSQLEMVSEFQNLRKSELIRKSVKITEYAEVVTS